MATGEPEGKYEEKHEVNLEAKQEETVLKVNPSVEK